MKAFALIAPGIFGQAEIPDEPPPGPGEVVVRPTVCGICASDVHYWRHGRIAAQVITSYPYVIGHECAGVVIERGAGVSNVKPGDRVAIEPGRSCGRCRPCREGRENICPNVIFLGTPMVQGAMRETILTSAENVVRIPDSMPFEHAALCEPLGVGLHAARLAAVAKGETVAIFGAGPIGLSIAIAAHCRGARRILIIEPIRERRVIAKDMGFEPIDTTPEPVERIHELTDGGVDIAFEAAGDSQAVSWTVAAARPGGRAAIVGIPVENTVAFDIHAMRRAELTLYNCRRSNRTLAEAIATLTGPGADIARVCTHRFPVAECARAFDLVSRRADGVVKAALMLN